MSEYNEVKARLHEAVNHQFEDAIIKRDVEYVRLREVLNAAFLQASTGKGKERHGNDLPFHKQRMQTISQALNSDRGMAFQVCKKVLEGLDLEHNARERELLGAINYIAGIIIYHQEKQNHGA